MPKPSGAVKRGKRGRADIPLWGHRRNCFQIHAKAHGALNSLIIPDYATRRNGDRPVRSGRKLPFSASSDVQT
jgi:hypothetical protein